MKSAAIESLTLTDDAYYAVALRTDAASESKVRQRDEKRGCKENLLSCTSRRCPDRSCHKNCRKYCKKGKKGWKTERIQLKEVEIDMFLDDYVDE